MSLNDNGVTITKLQTACFHQKNFKRSKLLNMTTQMKTLCKKHTFSFLQSTSSCFIRLLSMKPFVYMWTPRHCFSSAQVWFLTIHVNSGAKLNTKWILRQKIVLIFNTYHNIKKASEYDQETPQSHIADQPWHREEEPQNMHWLSQDIR